LEVELRDKEKEIQILHESIVALTGHLSKAAEDSDKLSQANETVCERRMEGLRIEDGWIHLENPYDLVGAADFGSEAYYRGFG